jgi:hypothetical protein
MGNLCTAPHPKTGTACTKEEGHVNSSDAQERQHAGPNGLRWPTLHELDPHEGYNDYVTHRM